MKNTITLSSAIFLSTAAFCQQNQPPAGGIVGVMCKAPYRVDVTDALKAGQNQVEVKVTNLWVNLLIGDKQPDVTSKFTSTLLPYYQADFPLVPSGLLGPVKIIAVKKGAPASSHKLQ